MAVLTSPATAAVAVAMAGMIFPAMRFVFSLSAGSMEYIRARMEEADVTKSMWPLLSSSFSNWRGLICNPSAKPPPKNPDVIKITSKEASFFFAHQLNEVCLHTWCDLVCDDGLLKLCDGFPLLFAA